MAGLTTALAAAGLDVSLATLDYSEHGALAPTPNVRTAHVPPSAATRLLRGWSREFPRALDELAAGGVDVVHNHGLWMGPGVYARRLAARHHAPLIISPRGMLDRWSLRRNRVRKAVALALYERANLQAAAAFHATSDAEADMLREWGCRQPVAVIPNGVELGGTAAPRSVLEVRFPQLAGKRWLVFLGRLHAKKGVGMLLQAWARIALLRPDWHLLLAGPDLDGQGAQFEAQAASDAGLHGRVTFTGMLEGEAKSAALAGAGLVVLPTFSENFGIAVVEALAAGVPVITTTGAPWRSLVDHGCGWWIQPQQDALEEALLAATARSDDELATMGLRGIELARHFTWPGIARHFVEVYSWLVGGGEPPACVRTQ